MTEPPVARRAALISAGMICFCAGSLYGWSALIPLVEQGFGASTEQSGLVFSVAIVAFTVSVIAAPRLPTVFNGLVGCAVFGCAGAGCLALASLAPSYLWFLLAFGVGFGLCSGGIYINALAIAAKSLKPAVITPLIVASFGLGGAVSGVVWQILLLHEWGALSLLPLVLALIVMAGTCYVVHKRSTPIDYVEPAIAAVSAHRENPGIIVLLWLSFALGSMGGLMVLGLAGKMTDSAEASALIITIAIAGVALGNTLGRLLVSVLNYLIKPVNTALLAVTFAIIGLAITSLATWPSLLVAGLIIVAIGYGAVASTIPALVGAIYGKERFSSLYSIVFTAWGVAGLIAPWLAGVIHDRTNDFQLAVLAALLATIGSAMALLSLKFVALR